MIGNDLVYLPAVVQVGKLSNKPFLKKVFTDQELTCLKSEEDIWRFWAAKEAAYKIVNRLTDVRKLSPKSFQVDILNEVVSTEIGDVILKFQKVKDCIHAICISEKVEFQTYFFSAEQHINSTKNILSDLNKLIQAEILFNKSGLPEVVLKGRITPISISHDKNLLSLVIPSI